MEKTLFLLIILCSLLFSSKKEDQYLDFLKLQKKSAKEYVLDLFKEYDIVVLCEREHKEFTQYELFLDIIKDPYFIENVGQVFTEVGVSNIDDKINEYLQTEYQDSSTARNKVTSVFRELDSSPWWHCYSYPWFLFELNKLNTKLSRSEKITLHPSDIAFDWSVCKSSDDYVSYVKSIVNRDSLLAQNIISKLNQLQSKGTRSKKALVIMNYKHAFLKDHRFEGVITNNTARYLSDQYKGKVASVYIMGLAIPEVGNYTVVKNGLWDYYFEKSDKTDVGFNLTNTPFGQEEFDVIPPDSLQQFVYTDMFTGLVFYKPLQEHELKTGWNDFATTEFLPELRRRINIFNEAMGIGMTKEDIEGSLFDNNIEKTFQYNNIGIIKGKIDNWKNGL